jgi:hypothetical protein
VLTTYSIVESEYLLRRIYIENGLELVSRISSNFRPFSFESSCFSVHISAQNGATTQFESQRHHIDMYLGWSRYRRCIAPAKVECQYCGDKFYPRQLITHLKYLLRSMLV